jgi:predicted nuclease of predicted toxin-antitoxin system
MRILLDENMPEPVRRALQDLGHEVDSVVSLQLRGLDNGRLYREVAQAYDLFLTRDRGLVAFTRTVEQPTSVKVIRVTLPQLQGQRFTEEFIRAFTRTDWSVHPSGSDWPG